MKLLFLGALLFWAAAAHSQEAERAAGIEHSCGTFAYLENQHRPRLYASYANSCNLSKDSVHERVTQHFAIYYTLEGPHRVASANTAHPTAYIDSLAKYLEAAHALYGGDQFRMGKVLGATSTLIYQQQVPESKYPVEVLDIGPLVDMDPYMGVTIPGTNPHQTQIWLENDFRYGANCTNPSACTDDLSSGYCQASQSPQGEDYWTKWWLPLKATAVHELYHAFQFVLFDATFENPTRTIWAEASATGAEEVAAPEVNDYWRYIKRASSLTGTSLTAKDGYGAAPFYLFLLDTLGPGFDRQIWDFFKKYQQEDFWTQYSNLMAERKLDGEKLFFKFASSMLYTGARAQHAPDSGLLFTADQASWPAWKINTEHSSPTIKKGGLARGAFDLVNMAGRPVLDSVGIDSLVFLEDTLVHVLSRVEASASTGGDRPFYAYPNPWNPLTQTVKFKNPPAGYGIEFRTADGQVFERIPKDKVSREWSPQHLPAPGILYYRALPHGNLQKLLVVY